MTYRTFKILLFPICLAYEIPIIYLTNNSEIGFFIALTVLIPIYYVHKKYIIKTATEHVIYQFRNKQEIELHLTTRNKTLQKTFHNIWPYLRDTKNIIEEIKLKKYQGLNQYKNIKSIKLTSHLITPNIAKRYGYIAKKESLYYNLSYLTTNTIMYFIVHRNIRNTISFAKENYKRGLYTIQIDI